MNLLDRICTLTATAFLLVVCGNAQVAPKLSTSETLQQIQLPPGFEISEYACEIPGARMMALAPNGDLFVSAMGSGDIVVLKKDSNGDGRPDGRSIFLSGLRQPHGIAFGNDDYFYFAEETQISRVPYLSGDMKNKHKIQTIIRGLPTGGHSTKTIGFDGLGKLYVSVGSSCNVCIEKDKRRGTIVQYDPNGAGERLYATGIRNAVGMAWHPRTGHLFATVNGRDLLGDGFSADTLIRAAENSFHGWPFASEDRVPAPDFGKGREKEIASMVLPEVKFQAHSGALGISFYEIPEGAANPFPPEYRHDAFVGFHGTWNRSARTGGKVVRVLFDEQGRGTGVDDFATGWVKGEQVLGRPVSTQPAPDGSLFVTDDMKGCVYRISYAGTKTADAGTTATR